MTDSMQADRRWKYPLTPFQIRRDFERPDPALVARLAGVDITTLSDLVGRMYTVDTSIRSLYGPALPMVGVATTVKVPPGDNLGVMKALSLVAPGDIIVIDGQGFTQWCLGGFQMLEYSKREFGLQGALVNGAYRDVGEAQAAGFPLYGKGVSPHSGPKVGPGEINVPVCVGGVIVHPGDVIAASGEGVVVVPRMALDRVARQVSPARPAPPSAADPDAGIKGFLDEMEIHVSRFYESGRGIYLD